MSAVVTSPEPSVDAAARDAGIRTRPSFMRRFLRHRMAAASLVFIVFIAIAALLTPYVSPYDPYAMQLPDRKSVV